MLETGTCEQVTPTSPTSMKQGKSFRGEDEFRRIFVLKRGRMH